MARTQNIAEVRSAKAQAVKDLAQAKRDVIATQKDIIADPSNTVKCTDYRNAAGALIRAARKLKTLTERLEKLQ